MGVHVHHSVVSGAEKWWTEKDQPSETREGDNGFHDGLLEKRWGSHPPTTGTGQKIQLSAFLDAGEPEEVGTLAEHPLPIYRNIYRAIYREE
jgi:hypothetical protein